MLIQKIKISNFKTYLSLDLDLTVDDDRPIILIGGSNGGGKTTLFEAISGALYGLKIENKEHFMELLNQGAINKVKPEISLQITFVGKVLGQQQKYILKRIYQLNPQGRPLESVSLNMNGNMYVYGTMTAPKERVRAEQEISKIIKANLPQELSQYFLFDAMQSSELLKKNVFQQTIRDNFENVLGFKKYLQLKRASEKLQQEWAQQRLEAEQEAKEYNNLCSQKESLMAEMNACLAEQDRLYKYMASVEDEYQRAKEGAQQALDLNKRIQDVDGKIRAITDEAADYAENLKTFIENIEINVFLPKLASNLSQEINNILRVKEQLLKQSTGAYPIETLRDVTAKIIDYLKELSWCSQAVDEENVVAHMIALQNTLIFALVTGPRVALVSCRWAGRIINIHPSLIPSFCGAGYYGLRVHEAALARGVKVTGATVHFVNEIPDGGEIIAQRAVEVLPGDTPEALQRRVMERAEWIILPQAAEKVAEMLERS